MVAVLKTVERGDPLRGFESLTFRNCKPTLSWFLVAQILKTAIGRLAEWFKATVWNTVIGELMQGFESLIFRKIVP